MTTIGLVGCAAAKLTRPAPARELYTSQLFRKASAYAEAHSDRWYILSALHGLVSPETVLEPYNVKLGHKSGPPIWEWAERVAAQLEAELAGVDQVELLVLAGGAVPHVPGALLLAGAGTDGRHGHRAAAGLPHRGAPLAQTRGSEHLEQLSRWSLPLRPRPLPARSARPLP